MRTSKWVAVLYGLIVLIGIIIALPNFFTKQQLEAMPSWFPKRQVTLGLDLSGGSYLVLEVDAASLKKDRMRALLDDARGKLRAERIQPQSIRAVGDSVIVTIPDADQRAKADTALKTLISQVNTTGFGTAINDIDVTSGDNQIRLTLTQAGFTYRLDAALQQSLEIIRQRVDQVGVAEPSIQRVGSDRIVVQLPGLQDPAHLRQLLGSTAKMSFHMVADANPNDAPPPGVTVLPDSKDPNIKYPIEDQVALSGERLTDARAGFDQRTNEPIVSFRFDSLGARQFADITTKNVGRPFAIVLDGKVLTAPRINEPITGGSGQITGNFTVQDSVVLSALLRAGALPAPLTVIEERTVGPDLGGDAIKMGLITGIAGFILVAVFIQLLYGVWGLIANVALLLHTVLTFSALSLIGATLTLPGIAGIILGIGIAVDANILINERIREETRKGLGAMAALDKGFHAAFATIVDSNVTSLISTLLLFMFGTGPVRGFAVAMMLGIVISMFTDVTLVRMAMAWYVRKRKLKVLEIKPFMKIAPENPNFRFMNARFIGIATSIVLSLASIGLFFKPGLNYGIDFKGGIQAEITTSQPADLAQLREKLGGLGLGEVALQSAGSPNDVLIRIQRQDGGEEAQTVAVNKMREAIIAIDADAKIDRTEVVGPKVSGELARSGFIAVVLSALGMLVYLWWRFEWFFAVGAIITLILDTTKMVGFFALLQLDFNLTAIAALLTAIGYSVNDKVVVYDRMRENMRLYKSKPLREIVDMSINQVLIRCIYTSVTTFLCLLPMAIWGGSAVHNFAVPMLFGIFIATTSSIFIAAPILLLLGNWWQHRQEAHQAIIENSATPQK
ncbi:MULTISPECIES: protein translocase subunit SecD [Brucella/Ochrobactrum group]|uniref:protein translocase subunit SecD n=1 Tax=Brucella/Ochrobactrum group TaxID=2826938 RepID=UPI0016562F07|nr:MULTISPECIES: protein translocase subunit SecD [Brucella/Ochrobactrum group]MBC8717178.1 protein translocase subunit SecD [Ochrobactrum sp. Marseille-Q0166]